MAAPLIGIGVRAQKGGAVAVAIVTEAAGPRLLASRFLKISAAGDRLALEPYHVAAAMPRGPQGKASAEAAAAVAEGRARQDGTAAQGLRDLVRELAGEGRAPVVALLLNRAGWVTDLLDYSLAWPEHAAVAEGLAVRDAFRFAADRCGASIVELDEKSLPDLAASRLGLSPAEMDAGLKALGSVAGKPWRKEQKLACLAAWVAAAAPG